MIPIGDGRGIGFRDLLDEKVSANARVTLVASRSYEGKSKCLHSPRWEEINFVRFVDEKVQARRTCCGTHNERDKFIQ